MKFVSRAEWGARPPRSTALAISPATTTGHWEGSGLWGGVIGSHDSCPAKVRAIQNYHMDHQGWTDIAYNGLGCPHGYVFEGRGPGRRSAANGTNTANAASHAFCYMAGEGDPFTEDGMQAMLDGAEWLGTPLDHCHSDWFATACPGPDVCPWIKAGHPSPHPPTPPPQPIPEVPVDQLMLIYPVPPDATSGVYLVHVPTGFYTPVDNDQQTFVNAGVKKIEPMSQGNWNLMKKMLDKVRTRSI